MTAPKSRDGDDASPTRVASAVGADQQRATRASAVQDRLRSYGLLPVVQLWDANQGDELFAALDHGGLPVAEITLRTSAGETALERLIARHPNALLGAGTVRSLAQARRMVAIGVSFVVSPGTDVEVIEHCVNHDVLVIPGVCTPSEIMRALGAGASLLKLFPAEAIGGVRYLQTLAGPFGDVSFVPTGGITSSNLESYLHLSQVAACGGSWMAAPELVAARRFDQITEMTREARAIVEAVRGGA
jgi:2-dehydro-3-deoxyphosphogluconate aldolase/(4S)-4-hydroxy-2-oxoglutarate aldolase